MEKHTRTFQKLFYTTGPVCRLLDTRGPTVLHMTRGISLSISGGTTLETRGRISRCIQVECRSLLVGAWNDVRDREALLFVQAWDTCRDVSSACYVVDNQQATIRRSATQIKAGS